MPIRCTRDASDELSRVAHAAARQYRQGVQKRKLVSHLSVVTEKKGMDAWKVSFECQNRSDGYENTHRKATGSTKYEPETARERAQGYLQQQEAGK